MFAAIGETKNPVQDLFERIRPPAAVALHDEAVAIAASILAEEGMERMQEFRADPLEIATLASDHESKLAHLRDTLASLQRDLASVTEAPDYVAGDDPEPNALLMYQCMSMMLQPPKPDALLVLRAAGLRFDLRLNKKIGFLDVVWYLYGEDSDDRLYKILCWAAPTMNTVRVLSVLSTWKVPVDKLEELCVKICAGSMYPIHSLLDAAHIFQKNAELPANIVQRDDWYETFDRFTNTASKMVDDVDSDVIVTYMLTSHDPLGRTPIDVAFSTNNKRFVGCASMTRFSTTIWSTSNFLQPKESGSYGRFTEGQGNLRLMKMWVDTPWDFYQLPVCRFILMALDMLGYLALFTLVVSRNLQVDSPTDFVDVVFIYVVATHMFNEMIALRECAQNHELFMYFEDEWNVLDALIYGLFTFSFVLKVVATFRYVIPGFDMVQITFLFQLCIGLNCILMWVRVAALFTVSPKLGPLLSMIRSMLDDIVVFGWFMAIFLAGFSISFYYLAHSYGAESFDDAITTLISSFNVFIGNVDYEIFDAVAEESATMWIFLVILLTILIILSMVLLFNLLIAMMASTYERVHDANIGEFIFGNTKVVYTLDSELCELGPPFNLLVYLISFAVEFLTLGGRLCGCNDRLKRKSRGKRTLSVPIVGNSTSKVYPLEETNSQDKIVKTSSKDDKLAGGAGRDAKENKEWYCMYCQSHNEGCTSEQSLANAKALLTSIDRDGHLPEELELLPPLYTCSTCFRSKNAASSVAAIRRVHISYYVFMVLMYIPVVLLVGIPVVLLKVFEKAQKISELDSEKRKQDTMALYDNLPVSRKVSNWVQRSRVDKEAELDDVFDLLSTMNKKGSALTASVPQSSVKLNDDGTTAPLVPGSDVLASGISVPPSPVIYNAQGCLVYAVGATVVCDDAVQHRRRVFNGHTQSVLCLAQHPSAQDLVATGQMAAEGSTERNPLFIVHDTHTRVSWNICLSVGKRSSSSIVGLQFSPTEGSYMGGLGAKRGKHNDWKFTVGIWDWQSKPPALLSRYVESRGQSKTKGLVWCGEDKLVTFGEKGYICVYTWATVGQASELDPTVLSANLDRDYACGVSDKFDSVYLGCNDGSICHVKPRENTVVGYSNVVHKGSVQTVVLGKKCIVSGGTDGRVIVQSMAFEQICQLQFKGAVTSVAVQEDNLLVTCNKSVFAVQNYVQSANADLSNEKPYRSL